MTKLTLFPVLIALFLVACGTSPAVATEPPAPVAPTVAPTTAPVAAAPLAVNDAGLHVSEIMYNPPDGDGVNGSELEFLELFNAGSTPVDLGNAQFRDGITFVFPADATLAPGAYLVLARSAEAFAARHGFTPDGTYGGALDNKGEQLTLIAGNGAVLAAVRYDITPPWPLTPDGLGFSLVPVDGQTAPDDGRQWRASRDPGGSPGQADPAPTVPRVLINEILAHTDAPLIDSVELFNPTDSVVDISGWTMTDDRSEPAKFRFGPNTIIGPGGYLVVTSDTLGFAFSELGEDVALFSATVGDVTVGDAFTGYDHTVPFAASPNGVSFGRYTTSTGAVHYPLQAELTLGAANAGPRVGPVVISAVNYRPLAENDAYVEITNISADTVPLFDPLHVENRWRLDGVGNYLLPAGIYLNAGATALIVADDPAAYRRRHDIPIDVQIFGPFDGGLARNGELLQLFHPDPPNAEDGFVPYILADAVEYGVDAPWPTPVDGIPIVRRDLTAYGNDPANWAQGLPEHVFLPLLAAAR